MPDLIQVTPNMMLARKWVMVDNEFGSEICLWSEIYGPFSYFCPPPNPRPLPEMAIWGPKTSMGQKLQTPSGASWERIPLSINCGRQAFAQAPGIEIFHDILV